MAGMTLLDLTELQTQRAIAATPMLATGLVTSAVQSTPEGMSSVAVNCDGRDETALVPIDIAVKLGDFVVVGHIGGRAIILGRLLVSPTPGTPTPPPGQPTTGTTTFPAVDARSFRSGGWRTDSPAVVAQSYIIGEKLVSTNLATNPGVEIWAGGGGNNCFYSNNGTNYPLSADITAPIAGSQSAMATRAGTMNTTVSSIYITPGISAARFPVTGGGQVTAALSIKTDAAGATIRLTWTWYDARLVSLGAVTGSGPFPQSTVPGTVYRAVTTDTAPPTAAFAMLSVTVYLLTGTNATPGQRVWYDQLIVTDGATDGSYFDGDTPDTATMRYDWTGTPNASTSTATAISSDPNGPNTGAWFYGGTPAAGLKGATITGARLRVRRRGGGSNATQTLNVYRHASDTRPTGNVTGVDGPFSFPISVGGTAWLTLPAAWGQTFVDSGGGVYVAGGDYIVLDGRDTDPQSGLLQLTWTRGA